MDNLSREYLINLLEKGKREDGRSFEELREVKVEKGVSKNAEGSARVRLGETEVVVGVKMEVGEPYPDKPDEGTIIVNAEMLPLSSPDFESGPPGEESIELARVVDRAIRESKALDFKKLCITPGEKVWLVLIDIYTLNNAGNLQDAATLAALAALKEAKFPAYDGEKVDYSKKKGGLPLVELPVECTMVKIKNKVLSDASLAEYKWLDSRLTVATMEKGSVCAMQKGGKGTLSFEDIKEMIKLSLKNGKVLRKELK